MEGSTVLGVLIVAITEGLSLVHGLGRPEVATAWVIVAGCTALWSWKRRPLGRIEWRSWLGTEPRILAIAIVFLLALTLSIALRAAPNTWDSLTYHMPRVAHWAQERSVASFPTHNLRQLHLGPFAEYAILQLQILTAGDRLANLVQWLAVAGTAVAASVVAARMGVGRRGQLLAALVVVATPMAVAQASSTQTDAMVAFWLVSFVALATTNGRRDSAFTLAAMGACLGLAALTKPTAYVFGLPLVVWFCVSRRSLGVSGLGRAVMVIAGIALALNVGFFARNIRLEGSPLGPGADGGAKYANERFDPAAIVSNVARNVTLHLGTPSHAINVRIDSVVSRTLRTLGSGPNDPLTTWRYSRYSVGFGRDDGSVGNPLELLLAVIAVAAVVIWPRRRSALERDMAWCLVTGFVLFCVLLKWQPWHSRLHLPLFMLAAPLIASTLDRWIGPRATIGLAVLLMATSLTQPLLDTSRPLVGPHSVFRVSRQESYVVADTIHARTLARALDTLALKQCDDLGLVSTVDSPEYELWAFSRHQLPNQPHIEAVAVDNISAALASRPPFRDFEPCALVSFDGAAGQRIVVKGRTFALAAGDRATVALYLPDSAR